MCASKHGPSARHGRLLLGLGILGKLENSFFCNLILARHVMLFNSFSPALFGFRHSEIASTDMLRFAFT